MIARYVTPWKYQRERREAERVRALKLLDLPAGSDQGARIEEIVPTAAGAKPDLANLRLTHRRCNASGIDHTEEVTERIRRKNEAELFARSKKRKRA